PYCALPAQYQTTSSLLSLSSLLLRPPPRSPPLPYPTLFRSQHTHRVTVSDPGGGQPAGDAAGPFVHLPPGVSHGGMGLAGDHARSEEHTSELQSRENLVCRLLLEKKKKK